MRCPKCNNFLVRAYGSQELICDICDVGRKSRTSLYSLKGKEIIADELPTKIMKLSESRQRMLTINTILDSFLKEAGYYPVNSNYVLSEKELSTLLERVFVAGMKHK